MTLPVYQPRPKLSPDDFTSFGQHSGSNLALPALRCVRDMIAESVIPGSQRYERIRRPEFAHMLVSEAVVSVSQDRLVVTAIKSVDATSLAVVTSGITEKIVDSRGTSPSDYLGRGRGAAVLKFLGDLAANKLAENK